MPIPGNAGTGMNWYSSARAVPAANASVRTERRVSMETPVVPGSRAAGGESVQEALEVIGVEQRCRGGAVAVCEGIARGKLIEKALEVVGVEKRLVVGVVAVGVARGALII